MGVTPITEFFLLSDVLLCYIVAARIGDLMVNNDNFTVIAVVQFQTENFEFRFEKEADLATRIQIVLEYMLRLMVRQPMVSKSSGAPSRPPWPFASKAQ